MRVAYGHKSLSTVLSKVPYSGKLLMEKLRELVENTIFVRKLLRIATKPQNLRKFSPLKVFSYYKHTK